MKHLSIRFKITFWFTAALIVVSLFTIFIVLSVSDQIIQKTIRDNLIETVEHNVDEIEFYASLDDLSLSSDVDHFVEYDGGYLEVDDDFLDEVNQIYTALYRADSFLLYGENPISKEVSGLKFIDSQMQNITVDGTVYYIFDRKLTANGLDGLWMRGIVSEEQGSVQLSSITRLSLVLLPLLVVLASVGGYLIARRMLSPIHKISETANQIGQANDLKKRIELGKGTDELHQLADAFNHMFAKLDTTFEAERRFISDASHELRTPVTVIHSQCEFSLEHPRTQEEYEEALWVIRRQSRKMSQLINDMLDFTRLETGAVKYPVESVDLTELVSSMCSDMALQRAKNITLQYEAEPGITIEANGELLSRLLTNLISNAYRYGKEDGHIWVCLKKLPDKILLSVADDGIGIAEEEQSKIFGRFYQVDPSRSNAGMGLGLSMANEIAKFHGGEIQVESAPEKGSVFTLILPCEKNF